MDFELLTNGNAYKITLLHIFILVFLHLGWQYHHALCPSIGQHHANFQVPFWKSCMSPRLNAERRWMLAEPRPTISRKLFMPSSLVNSDNKVTDTHPSRVATPGIGLQTDHTMQWRTFFLIARVTHKPSGRSETIIVFTLCKHGWIEFSDLSKTLSRRLPWYDLHQEWSRVH